MRENCRPLLVSAFHALLSPALFACPSLLCMSHLIMRMCVFFAYFACQTLELLLSTHWCCAASLRAFAKTPSGLQTSPGMRMPTDLILVAAPSSVCLCLLACNWSSGMLFLYLFKCTKVLHLAEKLAQIVSHLAICKSGGVITAFPIFAFFPAVLQRGESGHPRHVRSHLEDAGVRSSRPHLSGGGNVTPFLPAHPLESAPQLPLPSTPSPTATTTAAAIRR